MRWLKVVVFVAALVPLGLLVQRGLAGAMGANPIEKITRTTGWWTLLLLTVTLAVTPLRVWSGWPWLGQLRRILGLFAFFYGVLHVLTYFVLDQFFDWMAIGKDILKRPYITVGFAAFMALIPLAVTSTDGMIRRLGGRTWRRLHRLVYVIATLGVVHFWWLVKKDVRQPTAFALILAVLLGWRALSAFRARGVRPMAKP